MFLQNLKGISSLAAQAPVDRVVSDLKVAAPQPVGTRQLVDPRAIAEFAAQEAPPPAAANVAAAVQQGNKAMASMSASLSFEIDSDSNTTVVKVIDTSDNSVIRQIPSQEMLDIARALDRVQGLLLQDQA